MTDEEIANETTLINLCGLITHLNRRLVEQTMTAESLNQEARYFEKLLFQKKKRKAKKKA